jgi:hypothetical protein
MAKSGETGTKRKAKTAAEIKADIAAAQKRLAAAEAKEYSGAVDTMINQLGFKSDFSKIKQAHPGAPELLILELIGNAVGIKRLIISQAPVKPRNKPSKK